MMNGPGGGEEPPDNDCIHTVFAKPGALDGGGGSQYHVSVLRNNNVTQSTLRNEHITLSNLRNCHVPCRYLFQPHVVFR